MSDEVSLSDWQIKNLAIPLVQRMLNGEIQRFYENPENEKRFRDWYFEKYGKPAPQRIQS